MTEKDFLLQSIDDLVKTFPNTRVRYENHSLSNTHFVEVVPNEVYRLNAEYQKWEENIVFQFIQLFPTQNICFISDDAIVGIENIEYEAKGVLYDLLFSFNQACYQTVEVTNFHTTYYGQPFSEIIVGQPSDVLTGITDLSFNISNIFLPISNGLSTCFDTIRPAIENAGNTQYAMAA